MVNSLNEEPEKNRFDELEEYVCSLAKGFGLERYADYDKQEKVYYPSATLEDDEEIMEYIQRYDDYTFWDKLIFNLAGRDMINKYGEEAFEKMTEEEYFKKERPFVEKYEKEFAKNGLKNFVASRGK